MPGPLLIVSASGMCENGRVLHHLRYALPDPKNVILLVGFQAEHTLGRRLEEGAKVARIFGEEVPVEAKVQAMGGWSAHADRGELLAALAPQAGRARVAFVVHGEERAAFALAEGMRAKGYARVEVPERGESFRI
jgi:metallo-beta-lactamase family protein